MSIFLQTGLVSQWGSCPWSVFRRMAWFEWSRRVFLLQQKTCKNTSCPVTHKSSCVVECRTAHQELVESIAEKILDVRFYLFAVWRCRTLLHPCCDEAFIERTSWYNIQLDQHFPSTQMRSHRSSLHFHHQTFQSTVSTVSSQGIMKSNSIYRSF